MKSCALTLPPAVREGFRERLREARRGVETYVLEKFDAAERIEFVAYGPSELDVNTVTDIEDTCGIDVERGWRDWLVQQIEDFCRRGKGNFALVRSVRRLFSESEFTGNVKRYCTERGDLFYEMVSSDYPTERVYGAISLVMMHMVVSLVALPESTFEKDWLSKEELTEEELKVLASHTKGFLTDIWDCEGGAICWFK
jgi:hypothetical protein